MRVVVTRARSHARSLVERLEDLGARVIELPLIEIVDPPSWGELDAAIAKLAQGSYAWVVFTSRNAVEKFWARLEHADLDGAVFRTTRAAAVGDSTAELLTEKGAPPALVPALFSARSLAAALGAGPGMVLIPRALTAPETLPRALVSSGWTIEVVPAYETRAPERPPEASEDVRAGKFEVLTFTSGSTVRNFARLVASPAAVGCAPGETTDKIVACIGPETARVATDTGFRVDLTPPEATVEGLVQAIAARFDGTIAR